MPTYPAGLPDANEPDDVRHVDPNTTLDVFMGPKNTITELADTVETIEGIRAETIEITNEKDRTHLEIVATEAPSTERPEGSDVDNFVTVDGIGPEVARLLLNAGIRTFRQLAETPVERIRAILAAAGPQFRIHDATEWPEQARRKAANTARTATA